MSDLPSKFLALIAIAFIAGCSKDTIVPVIPTPDSPAGQPAVAVKDTVKLSGTTIGSGAKAALDLGELHVITEIAFSSGASSSGKIELGLFEGAGQADFSDALPLGIIKENDSSGKKQHIQTNCSRGFRFVRFKTPDGTAPNYDAIDFRGYKGAGSETHYCQLTNLPTVVINTNNAASIVSKTREIGCNVYIIYKGGTRILETTETAIRGRGNASWDFPKKPYRIRFAHKQRPLDAPSVDRKWTLINNYGDKTLMRNILAFELSRRVGLTYTPFCQPVDLVLNGRYEGCYQFCDQVEVGTGRVPAKDGYLIEIDAYNYTEAVNFSSSRGIPVTVHYPKDDSITTAQRNFITNYFQQMENAVFASNFKDASDGYRKYLDLDSFLRNFIVGEFGGNTDTYWSVYMYKDADQGPLFTGPAWDYDLAFENDQRIYPINSLSGFIYDTKGSVADNDVRRMVNRIVKDDPAAKARLIELWDAAKPKLATLNDYVDSTAAVLEESQRLNFKRWPILNQRVHQNNSPAGSYAGEVQRVKTYITRRLTRFDELVRE